MNITKLLNVKRRIVLASESPRRKKLLTQLGLEFDVIPSGINEDDYTCTSPEIYSAMLALTKARAVSERLGNESAPIVIGADTIVVLGEQVLNKPLNAREAEEMLLTLSNNTHSVYTGLALCCSLAEGIFSRTAYMKTDVTFRKLNIEEIRAYIAGGSPMDKAGAYGIQDDFGAVFVSNIVGCYYNIVGLPLNKTYTFLQEFYAELNELCS
jgi:septum formation protein